jgi:hypothetical protein
MASYTLKLKEILRVHGCHFDRPGTRRRIDNPPQVDNLPHIASATRLWWCRIVAAREEANG